MRSVLVNRIACRTIFLFQLLFIFTIVTSARNCDELDGSVDIETFIDCQESPDLVQISSIHPKILNFSADINQKKLADKNIRNSKVQGGIMMEKNQNTTIGVCKETYINSIEEYRNCTHLLGDFIWESQDFREVYNSPVLSTKLNISGPSCIVLIDVDLGYFNVILPKKIKSKCSKVRGITGELKESRISSKHFCNKTIKDWIQQNPMVLEIFDIEPCFTRTCNKEEDTKEAYVVCKHVLYSLTVNGIDKNISFVNEVHGTLEIINSTKTLNLTNIRYVKDDVHIRESPNLTEIVLPSRGEYNIYLYDMNSTKIKRGKRPAGFTGEIIFVCTAQSFLEQLDCNYLNDAVINCEANQIFSNVTLINGTLKITAINECLFDFDARLPKLERIISNSSAIFIGKNVNIKRNDWNISLQYKGFVIISEQPMEKDLFYELRWKLGRIKGDIKPPLGSQTDDCWYGDLIDAAFNNTKCKTFHGDFYVDTFNKMMPPPLAIERITGCVVILYAQNVSFLPNLTDVGPCIYPAKKNYTQSGALAEIDFTESIIGNGWILKSKILVLEECLPDSEYERWQQITSDTNQQLRIAGLNRSGFCTMPCSLNVEIGCSTFYGDLVVSRYEQIEEIRNLVTIYGTLTLADMDEAELHPHLLPNLKMILASTAPALQIKNNPHLQKISLPMLTTIVVKDGTKPLVNIQGNSNLEDLAFLIQLNNSAKLECNQSAEANCFFDSFYQRRLSPDVVGLNLTEATPKPDFWDDSEWVVVPGMVLAVMVLIFWIGLYIKERRQTDRPLVPTCLIKCIETYKYKRRANERERLRLEREKLRPASQRLDLNEEANYPTNKTATVVTPKNKKILSEASSEKVKENVSLLDKSKL